MGTYRKHPCKILSEVSVRVGLLLCLAHTWPRQLIRVDVDADIPAKNKAQAFPSHSARQVRHTLCKYGHNLETLGKPVPAPILGQAGRIPV